MSFPHIFINCSVNHKCIVICETGSPSLYDHSFLSNLSFHVFECIGTATDVPRTYQCKPNQINHTKSKAFNTNVF